MFIHLIALAKFEGQSLASHYASTNSENILAKRCVLREADPASTTAYSVHVLKTDRASFASVQAMDTYFADTRVYADTEPFFAALTQLGQATSADIAAYLLGLGDWQCDALQHLMYNIYADYLTACRQPLFRATFTAGDQGPVDKCTVGRQLPPSHELKRKLWPEPQLLIFWKKSRAVFRNTTQNSTGMVLTRLTIQTRPGKLPELVVGKTPSLQTVIF